MEGTRPSTVNSIGMFDMLKGMGMIAIVLAHTAELYPMQISGGLSLTAFFPFIYREALMTTTVPNMQATIEALHAAHLDCKVMVGGAVLTPEGEQILAAYQRFSADINAYSQARFQEAFQDWI